MNFLFKNWLSKEVEKWKAEGVVSPETAQKIADRYEFDLQKREDKRRFVLQLVAYLFIAMSVFTLIGANWDEIPRWIRLILVLMLTLGVNFSAFYADKKGKENFSTGLFFLGNFCYGGAIALIAQIYHLGEHMPDGIFLWAVGAMALSLAVGRSVLVAQSLAIALGWFLAEYDVSNQIAYGLGIFILLSMWQLWRESSRFLALVIYISLYFYLMNIFRTEFDVIFYAGWGILAYALLGMSAAQLFIGKKREEIGHYLHQFSVPVGIITILSLVVFSYGNYHYVTDRHDSFYNNQIYVMIADVFGLFCLLALIINIYKKNLRLIGLSVGLLLLPILCYYTNSEMIFSLISVILGGFFIKRNQQNWGLLMIFFVAIVRYVDLIGDYIGASLLFLAFAIIILIINLKKRTK